MRSSSTRATGRLRTWAAGAGFVLLAVAVSVVWFRPGSASPDLPDSPEPPKPSVPRVFLDDTPLVHVNVGDPTRCLARLSTYPVWSAFTTSETLAGVMGSHGWLRLGQKLAGLDPLTQGAVGRWLKTSLLAGELTLSVFDGEEPEGLLTVRADRVAALSRLLDASRAMARSPAGSCRVWITKHARPPLCVAVLDGHWAAATSKELLVRFAHSYARADGDPCRALSVRAIDRTAHALDVELDCPRLVKAKWFRRYYVATLDAERAGSRQRWRVTLDVDRVTIDQDTVDLGPAKAIRAVADPYARLAPACAVAYQFACADCPDPRLTARVGGWLAEALGEEWREVRIEDAACWTVPGQGAAPGTGALVTVVAARFRDVPGARRRLTRCRNAWAEVVGGRVVRTDRGMAWCLPYRDGPRLVDRWCGDVLVVGSGAGEGDRMVAPNAGASLAAMLGAGPVLARSLVRWDRLAACVRREATGIRHTGGWGGWTTDQWAGRQLDDLLDWSSLVPVLRQTSTVNDGRLHVRTELHMTATEGDLTPPAPGAMSPAPIPAASRP